MTQTTSDRRLEVAADPPIAAVRPHRVASPHGTRTDPYYWLRDDEREDPEVLAYLQAENAYQELKLAAAKPLEDQLFAEIVARLKQDDASVPFRLRGYWYYTRYEVGQEHPVYARRWQSLDAPEEVLLDANQLAAGHDYHQIGALAVSPDSQWLAFSEDYVGRREYRLRLKNLATGELHDPGIANIEADVVWANDNRTLLYVEKDPETLLGLYVKKHVVGTSAAEDVLVFQQSDRSFYTSVEKSKSERYLFIQIESTVASEWHYADADDPNLEFRLFLAHERDHEYQLEHLGPNFIVRTNWQAPNFRIMSAPIEPHSDRSAWREIVPHRDDTFVEDFEVFADFLALSLRVGGLHRIAIQPAQGAPFLIGSEEAAYSMSIGVNPELATHRLRYTYSSLTTPTSVYDYDVRTGQKTLLKRDPVLGSFVPEDYRTEFLFAQADDGAQIPVSLVYHKDTRLDGTAPLLQYAYGAYGISLEPSFSSARLSLLDRGFVYAIGHVRGGQELGRAWYDAGRLAHKMNSFTDFIAVTRHLVAQKYAARDAVFAMGGSAGGLLVAAVANLAPQDYRGIVAEVPFVDVVTTMLDEGIPLTTNEYDEWGNPVDRSLYEYMLAYSPYDNVRAQPYPAMLVTTGLWDSQVQYYEPAKWVAKLRALKTDANLLLLHTDMEAGHGGKSGRFQRYREIAKEYAFILSQLPAVR
jgi:oligopeptidase B